MQHPIVEQDGARLSEGESSPDDRGIDVCELLRRIDAGNVAVSCFGPTKLVRIATRASPFIVPGKADDGAYHLCPSPPLWPPEWCASDVSVHAILLYCILKRLQMRTDPTDRLTMPDC